MGTPSGNPSFGPLFTGGFPVRLTPQTGIPGRGALFVGVRAPLVFSGKVRAGGAGARRAHIGAPQGVAPSTLLPALIGGLLDQLPNNWRVANPIS
jgi:hypothetical protein